MKRLGLTLGAALFLCAGAGWYFFIAPGRASAAESPAPAGPVYVELAPLALPVIDGDRIQQILQFTITVEAADEKAAGRIRDVQPRLADAYIQDLYGALERRRVLDGRIVDVARLRDELTRISTGVLGENTFRAILIQRVSQRMM